MRARQISENELREPDAAALNAQLREEQAAREAAERQVLALTTEKRLLEYRVINAHRTLAHGLGRALIEARSLKGLLALPGRIKRLRMKQKVKRRERVPNSFTDDVAALLRLVDPAFERARTDGIEAAADWVKTQKAETGTKARALTELAHWLLDTDTAAAGRLAEEAARLHPGDQRLFSLAVRLREQGLVIAPAGLCAAIRNHQPLSQPQSRLCDLMAEDAAILESGVWGDALEPGTGSTSNAGLAIVCPPRWAASPHILTAQKNAAAAGLSVSIVTPANEANFREYAAVHIFADSIAMACSSVRDVMASGCRIILDIANPPASQLTPNDSELAVVDSVRLKGLGVAVDTLIVRSRSLTTRLAALDIDHLVAGDVFESAGELDDVVIVAALAEYGVKPGIRTIGCLATLDDDAGLFSCLEAFAEIANSGDAEQLLIFGKGSHSTTLQGRAENLGIADHVHFLGMPPPQRWSALLASLNLAVFPRIRAEALGSDIPMIFVRALVDDRPVLATEAVWDAQVGFAAEPDMIVTPDGNLVAQVRRALQQPTGRVQRTSVDDPLAGLYEAFIQPL